MNFVNVPLDVLRIILLDLDWKVLVKIATSSKRLNQIIDSLWPEKATKEFKKKRWESRYLSNLDNYLCARVKYLLCQRSALINNKFDKFIPGKHSCFAFGNMLDHSMPNNKRIAIPCINEWTGIETIRAINDYERKRGNKAPFLLERGRKLSLEEILEHLQGYYFEVLEAGKGAGEIRNEIVLISAYLASQLAGIIKNPNIPKEGVYEYFGWERLGDHPCKGHGRGEISEKEIRQEKEVLLSFGVPYFNLSILYGSKNYEYADYSFLADFMKEEFE